MMLFMPEVPREVAMIIVAVLPVLLIAVLLDIVKKLHDMEANTWTAVQLHMELEVFKVIGFLSMVEQEAIQATQTPHFIAADLPNKCRQNLVN